MEIKAKNVVIWLVLLIIGFAMIVGPVVSRNFEPSPLSPKHPSIKTMDSKVPIATGTTTEDKDMKVKDLDKDKKDKKDNTDPIKIKCHPVLK